MAKAKRYTAEQLSDAEKMAAALANVPEEKRTLVIMMTKRATREYDIRAAMKAIRAIAGAYGLTIENRITFKDKETEEIFR